jgi:hypothetical protein
LTVTPLHRVAPMRHQAPAPSSGPSSAREPVFATVGV